MNKKSNFGRYIVKIFKMSLVNDFNLTAKWILTTLILSIFPILIIDLSRYTIDNLSVIASESGNVKTVMILLLATCMCNVFIAIGTSLSTIFFNKIEQKLSLKLHEELFEKLVKLPLLLFEDDIFYKNIDMARQAISRNSINIIKYLLEIIKNMLVLIGIITILVTIHWALPIILFIASVPGIIAILVGKRIRFKMNYYNTENRLELNYLSSLFFSKSVTREIRIFDSSNFFVKKWKNIFSIVSKENTNLIKVEEFAKTLGVLILQVCNLFASIYLVSLISDNRITVGVYVSMITATSTVQGTLASIWSNVAELFEAKLYSSKLFEILNLDNCMDSNEQQSINDFKIIEVRNLSFKYPKSEKEILKNINLDIEKGASIAIVGENGSGKSTLVNLLLGIYNEYDGEILVDKINLKYINMESYYSLISAVFQNFTCLHQSLKTNILFGLDNESSTDIEINEVLKKLGIDNRCKEFKNGLDTMLNKQFKDGEDLSGGEWQKIAIGRVMLRNPKLIILDEPTSALDPISELEIFRLFESVSKNKTTITISHRLGITRFVDKIIVMNKGEIIEIGSHNELIRAKGHYFNMYKSQAKWYDDNTQDKSEILIK